eukprot:650658-Amphidinium_carterae.1
MSVELIRAPFRCLVLHIPPYLRLLGRDALVGPEICRCVKSQSLCKIDTNSVPRLGESVLCTR